MVGVRRRCSAAARHLVWLVALAGLPALSLLSAAVPAWHVLPSWVVPPAVQTSAAIVAPAPSPDVSRAFIPGPQPIDRAVPPETSASLGTAGPVSSVQSQ